MGGGGLPMSRTPRTDQPEPAQGWLGDWTRVRARIGLLFLAGTTLLFVSNWMHGQVERDRTRSCEFEKLRYATEEITDQQQHVIRFAEQLSHGLASDGRLLTAPVSDCSAILQQHQRELGTDIANLWVLTMDGHVRCAAQPGPLPESFALPAALADTATSDQPVVGSAFGGQQGDRPLIGIYQSLRGTDHALPGVLVTGIDLGWLASTARLSRYLPGRVVSVVEPTGRILYQNPDPGHWQGRNARYEPLGQFLAQQGQPGWREMNGFEGDPRLVAFTPLVQTPAGPLLLALSRPVSVVDASTPQTLINLGLASLVVLVAIMFVLWFASDRLASRSEAERALAANQRLLADAEAIGHTGSWSIDFAANSMIGSDELFRILGIDRAHFAGTATSLRELVHPDDQERLENDWHLGVDNSRDNERNYRIIRPNGEVREVRARSRTVRDDQGVLTSAVGTVRDITDEMTAIRAQAERDGMFASLVGQARDAVAIIDPQTMTFIEFNEAAHRGLGYTREAFAQTSVRALWPPESLNSLDQSVDRMMEPGGSSINTRLQRQDGTLRDTLVSARPITVNGQVRLAAIWVDITAQKINENKLFQISREQRMLAAANRAILYATTETSLLQSVCEVLVDHGGYVMAWAGHVHNDKDKTIDVDTFAGTGEAYVRALALTWRDTPRGQGPSGRAVRSMQPMVAQHIDTEPFFEPWRESALAHGYASCLAVPMLPVKGRASLLLNAYSSNPEAFGQQEMHLLESLGENLAFGVKVLRDRVARLQAENENVKLSLAIEQSPSAVVVTNLQAEIEYVNEAFVKSSGYARNEVLGRNPRFLQSGKTPHQTYIDMWSRLGQGLSWQGEFVNRRKDGSEFNVAATLTPIRQLNGEVTHYLALKEDVSERKRLYEELSAHRDHLEDLVNSRTVELGDAQRKAKAANVAKTAFLANMSHEIRTPMNAISGLTHLLQESAPRDDQRERLQKIDRSARHLLSIINDILDLSKVEAGKLKLEEKDFALHEILGTIADQVGERAREKGLTFALICDPTLPRWVRGDSLRLSQILLNLGTNAVKFTHDGQVALHVHSTRSEQGGLTLRFEMHDTGIGLTPEHKGRLFQPFEQADESTTRRFGGTGLGLTICQRLAELLGGTIGVESELNRGSMFWVILPFARAHGSQDGLARVALGSSARVPRPTVDPRQVRILIVEDDAINQEVATDLLRSKGFVIDVADNGQAALLKAAAQSYDAILMDVQMPVMDGLTATRRLRQQGITASTPILAMTAGAFAEDKAACQQAGMDDFIAKPIQPAALFATISRWTGAEISASGTPHTDDGLAEYREKLQGLSVLNTAAGLQVVQGDWGVYIRLLQRFCRERADLGAEMRRDVLAGQWPEAQRAAHTLKGLAAMIGAESLRLAALEVETAIGHGVRDLKPLVARVDALESALRALIEALTPCLPAEKHPTAQAVDWPKVQKALLELRARLRDDDVQALETFRNYGDALGAAMGPQAKALRRAIDAFDFDQALTILNNCFRADRRLSGEHEALRVSDTDA